jgi:hypothetical protein
VLSAREAVERPRAAALGAMASGALGVISGVGVAWPLRAVLGAAIGLAAYWLVPTLWACVVALRAPTKQRDDARTKIKALKRDLGEQEKTYEAELAVQSRRSSVQLRDAEVRQAILQTHFALWLASSRPKPDLVQKDRLAEWLDARANELQKAGASDHLTRALRFSNEDRRLVEQYSVDYVIERKRAMVHDWTFMPPSKRTKAAGAKHDPQGREP